MILKLECKETNFDSEKPDNRNIDRKNCEEKR